MRNAAPARRLAPTAYRALAASRLRTPSGTDLVPHERHDPGEVRLGGRRLAGVAIPLLDLRLADTIRREVEATLTEAA